MRRHVAIGASVLGAVALLAVAANASLGDADVQGEIDGPVISLGEDWDVYPTALVSGRITLAGDCLLLGDLVVFWPHRTTWDEDRRSVEFGGDFEAAAPASLDERFVGGGGIYSADNLRDMEGLDAEAVLRCIRSTGSNGAVFAYPDT